MDGRVTVQETTSETAEGTRVAFRTYVASVLSAVIGSCELWSVGECLHIKGFRLRDLDGTTARAQSIPDADGAVCVRAAHLDALLCLTTPLNGPLVLREGSAQVDHESLTWDHRADTGLDFAFCYPLAEDRDGGPTEGPPAVLAYLTDVLEVVLDCVDLLDGNGRTVFPDAVSVGDLHVPLDQLAPWQAPRLGQRSDGKGGTGERQPLHSVVGTEPAIVCLARHWGLLAPAVAGNGTRMIDGFRLRRLSDWVVDADGHPAEVYEYLARVCNVKCEFCYLYGNPRTLAVARGAKVIKDTELETRLRYFDPGQRLSLFHAQWEINEFLVDPKVHQLLPALRERTPEPFYFITNGSPLKPKIIELLAAVQPVHLIVSINSLDEDLRATVMNERTGQTTIAISALRELAAHRIPFGISLAAFPDFPLSDLRRTIRIVNEIGAGFVRVNLPGFTRELPYQGSFDTEARWNEVMHAVQDVRRTVRVPVFSIPSALEHNHLDDDPLLARVIGTVPNSPAARAGLRPGDVVRSIGAFPVRPRADVLPLLALARDRTRMVVERHGETLTLELVDVRDEGSYPYTGPVLCKYLFPWGVVAAPSLSASAADQVAAELDAAGAGRAWVSTSALMRPAAEALFARFAPELIGRIDFVLPENEFLGGNIRVQDMATIGDIARAIERKAACEPLPDLLLVPESGFNRHGRDLQGRHWQDLERYFGRPVRLIRTSRFSY